MSSDSPTTLATAGRAAEPGTAPVRRLAVVGLGLIGASVALAVRQRMPQVRLIGVDQSPDVAAAAVRAGVVHELAADIGAAAATADLLLLAVPVRALPCLLQALAPVADGFAVRNVVVTDVGSTKAPLLKVAESLYGATPAWLVPGHPLAGSERSGWAAGRADLFTGRRVLLCPTETNADALQRVGSFWRGLGAQVELMSAAVHDELLAQTSHLPHMLAFALVDALIDVTPAARLFRYSGGGFRDMTRLAGSDAVMWRDIALDNQAPLLAALDALVARLGTLRGDIAGGDGAALEARFERARRARDDNLSAND